MAKEKPDFDEDNLPEGVVRLGDMVIDNRGTNIGQTVVVDGDLTIGGITITLNTPSSGSSTPREGAPSAVHVKGNLHVPRIDIAVSSSGQGGERGKAHKVITQQVIVGGRVLVNQVVSGNGDSEEGQGEDENA